ncbi:MAG TPA: MBL fold metallo-hydrolase [Gemmatimonadaceae bacterium]
MTDVRLTHIGGPTVLIELGPWRILTDPTFDPPGKRYPFALGTSSVKVGGPAVPVRDLPPIDVVLLTHDHHADNLDDAGRELLRSAREIVTTVPGAKRLGPRAYGLAPWATRVLERPGYPSIEVTATPCRHGPPASRWLVGHVIGFALKWEGQQHGAFWISGDTVFYSGMREVASRLRIGTALLHLGGVRFPLTGPLRYTMTASDAIRICRMVRPNVAIPVHYEGWSHFQEGKSAIERAFAASAEPAIVERIRWIPLGTPAVVST